MIVTRCRSFLLFCLVVCGMSFATGHAGGAGRPPVYLADVLAGQVQSAQGQGDLGGSTDAKSRAAQRPVDIAPSARVVTSDPSRIQGTAAKRNDPMPAKDIFLTTELKPEPDGSYRVPPAADGRSAIGLEWAEMRILRRLELHWGDGAAMPPADGVQLQYWVGFQGRGKFDLWYDNRSCSWQGGWKPLVGQFEKSPGVWRWNIPADAQKEQPNGTYRVRWVFPASKQPLVVKRVSAFTPTDWATTELRVELQAPNSGKIAPIGIVNGEFAQSSAEAAVRTYDWNLAQPATLTVRYSLPKPRKNDRTVLRFELPQRTVSVAVEDVLKNGCVYVPSAGLFVTGNPPKITLADYLQKIANRKTVLQEVRAQPDQTFAQAMAKLHHATQDVGPMFASLACDNRKYIVHRSGVVQFDLYDAPDGDYCRLITWMSKEPDCMMAPVFGGAKGPLSRHLDGGWLPKPTTTAMDGGVKYQQCTYMAPIDDKSPEGCPNWYRPRAVCVADYTIENTRDSEAEVLLKLKFSSRDAKKRPNGLQQFKNGLLLTVGDRVAACIEVGPSSLGLTSKGNGVELAGKLAAGKSARLVVYLPGWAVKSADYAALISANHWAGAVEKYWNEQLAGAAQIDIPDPLLANVIRASQMHCMLVARNQERGRYVEPWVAAMAFGPIDLESSTVIRGMDMCGHADFARRGFDFLLDKTYSSYGFRYSDRGFFTTGYTLSGMGINLWVLGEHCIRCDDRQWLRSVAPQLVKACQWVVQQRALTKCKDANGCRMPEYGLMPPGVNGDYYRFAYSFFNDSQFCHGLEMIGRALATIGDPASPAILAEAQQYREDLARAFHWAQARCPVVALGNGTWVPNHPGTLYFAGHIEEMIPATEDTGRAWCDDVETGSHHLAANRILDPHVSDVAWMMDYLEDRQFLRSGWHDFPEEQNRKDIFNCGGFGKVQPYYVRNAEIYAMQDDVKPFVRSYYNALSSLLDQETLTLCEHFASAGAWDKTHETGWFLCQTATMFAMERGDDLWLAPMTTDRWLEDGKTVHIRNLPTRFGPVAYKVVSHVRDGYIEASIESPTRNPPKHVVLRIRHPEAKPMKSVTVDGKPYADFDPTAATVRLAPAAQPIQIRVDY